MASYKTLRGEALLKHLAVIAKRYRLTVWQWKPGHVGVHAPGSLHTLTYRDGVGRAFDAFGAVLAMRAYAWHLRIFYAAHLTEGIFNTGAVGHNLSVKDGRNVPASFWGSTTWLEHKNHVHVGI